ncbi:nucleoid occlusion protein [Dellaglioa algida]|uniref:Nucleoid occlusion protein n=1 Tax=Dellaglioa algida TaxID=105612 RepID=A0A5C6MCB5_9LACO|nr:nucleoid occlusion protein [Dellaglioa algida]MDK1716188.1 nucleoid occlusion protein [Dellaglioa algida]MDK1719469.1 nucleoid occlusion protein [Dellaglioa algida]MDK1721029.1 nucleoid occlusion protein [Dellaglioa algida]MDK1722812.1 nucleoid occlusion protein [Dellaglioa algida]MDK1724431.1 nucleoid occlusion protein [Dellaglioa algida]
MAFSFLGNRKNQQEDETNQKKVSDISIATIIPNRFQPRRVFDDQKIEELAQTIKEHGLLQPIILREYETGKYEIIAGERRFRAVTSLDWKEIPAIIREMNDDQAASMALIENLQREELTAIEEAEAYSKLMDLNHLSQSKLAENMGKSQAFIANKLRLLKLEHEVQTAIMSQQISERHGRAMVNLEPTIQKKLLKRILKEKLTVKETELLIAEDKGKPEPKENEKKVTKKANPDKRLVLNTLKQAVKVIEDNGVTIKSKQEKTDSGYRVIIDVVESKKEG